MSHPVPINSCSDEIENIVPGSSDVFSEPIGILLLDEQKVMREGLRLVIEKNPRFSVIGEADACTEAISLAGRERPDVILVDLNIGGADGANVIPELLEAARDARVIILMSIRDLRAYCSTVFLGARGLVLKEETSKTLINAIEKVHAGGVWIGSLSGTRLLVPAAIAGKGSDPEADKIALLTNREREVLAVAVAGLKNKQISKRLFISEATVSHHLTSIFSKLRVADRSQLIAYAYQHGLAGNAC